MSLEAAIQQVAEKPASVQARAELARALEQLGVPVASAIWAAAVQVAAGRGQFFAALTLARRKLRGAALDQALGELAVRYGAARPQSGRRVPPPMPAARVAFVPDDRSGQIALAVQLGRDLTGVLLPGDAAVPEVPLFSQLEPEAFVALAKAVEEVPLAEGQVLMAQGSIEPAVYLLAQGTAVVKQRRPDGERVLATVTAPALLGEMALLTAIPRRASVTVQVPGLAWRITADTLKRMGERHPEVVQELSTLVKRRLLHNLLTQSELLANLPEPDRVLSGFTLKTLPPGQIFPQGAPAPGLFLLVHGAAEVWAKSEDDSRVRVAVLDEGDAFGEMSLLSGEPTMASVLLPEGGVVLHLSAETYHRLGHSPNLEATLGALADIRRGELMAALAAEVESETEVDARWLVWPETP